MRAARDKRLARERLAAGGVPQPRFAAAAPGDDVAALARAVGLPCVVKPVGLSGSRGVIRADDAEAAAEVAARVRAILEDAGEDPEATLLVEEFAPGREVAVEGLLRGGRLEILAVFDKPDPLDGPYFEETIYVTPSRLEPDALARVEALTAEAARALGLSEGPVHAELRVDGSRVRVLELAARSIGGLCARSLRFGLGVSLEELVLRHALGRSLEGMRREPEASGVMMLPIPAAGRLERVEGQAPGAGGARHRGPRALHPPRATSAAPARGRPLPRLPLRPRLDPGGGRGRAARGASPPAGRRRPGRARLTPVPRPAADGGGVSVHSVHARVAELQAILQPPRQATPTTPDAASFGDLLGARMTAATTPTATVAAAPGTYAHLTGDLDAAPELLARLEQLAARRGETFHVTSGTRTRAEQERLWAARASNPYPVARPGSSLHESGRAADVTVGGRAIQDVVPAGELRAVGLSPLAGDAVHVELA